MHPAPRTGSPTALQCNTTEMPRPLQYRIIGSGPVALACALFMVRGGIDPARLSLSLPAAAEPAQTPTPAPTPAVTPTPTPTPTPTRSPRRMLAISEGSRQLLSRVVAMPEGGVIERIEVAMLGRSGRTRIDAGDFGVSALGHVVAYPDLVSALRDAVEQLPTARASEISSETVSGLTHVIIHADGLPRVPATDRSGLRGRDSRFRARAFDQAALLTEVVAAHAGTTAYECFGRNGPLALLPAGARHDARYAIVWCDEPHVTRERAAMTPARLSVALTEAVAGFGIAEGALGTLRVCAPVEVAPLSRLLRVDSAAGREVWIGNAAQALHPVAGQGLNLGLRDAFELARSLADNEFAEEPLAAEILLARFASRRRLDRAVTTGATDLLASAFGWPLLGPVQSALLTAMDILPPLRRPLSSTLLFGRR